LVQVNILKPGGSLEKKSSSEDRKAINMENLELTQDFRSLQPWAQFGGGHGGRGTCPPHFFRWGENMPCPPHFFSSDFVFGEVPKIKVTFATFCVTCFSC